MDAPDRRLTREEFLAGLARLAVVLVLLFALGVGIGLLLASSGNGDTRGGIANGLTLVGACILVFAAGSWLHTGPLRRDGMHPRLAGRRSGATRSAWRSAWWASACCSSWSRSCSPDPAGAPPRTMRAGSSWPLPFPIPFPHPCRGDARRRARRRRPARRALGRLAGGRVLDLADVGGAVEAALGHGRSWGGEVELDGHVTGVEVVPLGDLAVVVVGTPAVSGRLLDAVLAASLDATSVVRLLRDEDGEAFDLLVVDTNDTRRPPAAPAARGDRRAARLPPAARRRATADSRVRGRRAHRRAGGGGGAGRRPGRRPSGCAGVARLPRDQLVVATRDVTGTRLEEAGDNALRRIALAIAERRSSGDVLDLVAEEAVGLLGGDQASCRSRQRRRVRPASTSGPPRRRGGRGGARARHRAGR